MPTAAIVFEDKPDGGVSVSFITEPKVDPKVDKMSTAQEACYGVYEQLLGEAQKGDE